MDRIKERDPDALCDKSAKKLDKCDALSKV
ncbi:Uncharacterised protein [Salmonella enterica subsp. arizonae]|nr:Uncharacterised protein [Salmonella enterica subsp. arizonae]